MSAGFRKTPALVGKYVIPVLGAVLDMPTYEQLDARFGEVDVRFNGALLPYPEFPDNEKLREVLCALRREPDPLIYCPNWEVGGKRFGSNQKTQPARRFFPCQTLVAKALYSERYVSTAKQHYRGRNSDSSAPKCLVSLDSESGVSVPSTVVLALEAGTGLLVDGTAVQEIVARKNVNLGAVWSAVHRSSRHIVPREWVQTKYGDISARGPAIQNLPAGLRSAYRSIDQLPIHYVDFSSFFPRLACALAGGVELASVAKFDPYTGLMEHLSGRGIAIGDRAQAKQLVNAFINGRTEQSLRFSQNPEGQGLARIWPDVELAIKAICPAIHKFRQDGAEPTARLYTNAAKVFLAAVESGLGIVGGRYSGIPLHDGWIFAATPEQAECVKAAWPNVAANRCGARIPVTLDTLWSAEAS